MRVIQTAIQADQQRNQEKDEQMFISKNNIDKDNRHDSQRLGLLSGCPR